MPDSGIMDKDRVRGLKEAPCGYPRRSATALPLTPRVPLPPSGVVAAGQSKNSSARGQDGATLIALAASEDKLRRISSAPEMCPPPVSRRLTSTDGYREAASKVVGSIASCLLVGSCVQTWEGNPELASLVVSGRVDVLSAKVCTLSIDMDLEPERNSHARPAHRRGRSEGGVPLSEGGVPLDEAGVPLGEAGPSRASETMADFLAEGGSATADEASCLASSGAPDEPEANQGTLAVRRAPICNSARGNAGSGWSRGYRQRGRRQ